MAWEWGGWTWNGALTEFRRSKGPRQGGTDGERASGATTKILSRWSGGYREKYGCTRKGGGDGDTHLQASSGEWVISFSGRGGHV